MKLSMINKGLLGAFICLSAMACTPDSPSSGPSLQAESKAALPDLEGKELAYAFHNMAWDGEKLWQFVHDEAEVYLLSQQPVSQETRKIALQTRAITEHKSLKFAQGHFWLLNPENTLYQLDTDGKLLKTLPLELPFPGGAEQIAWFEDELWLLHGAFLSTEGINEKARLYQLNPENGAILKEMVVQDTGFSQFLPQNLAADNQAFYVVRANIFVEDANQVYRIDKASLAVTTVPLGRVYTGLPSAFFVGDTLYGIELLDLIRECGVLCRGVVHALPLPEAP